MCGIVGIFDTSGPTAIDRALLDRMNQSQLHRGPDAGGLHVEPGIGLGHRRLSIIDLSSGQQPLANEDQSVWVSFNGEIYNFPELSRELAAAGHVFKTHSDTEVIVHAWEQWGTACVERFRGMFAFAVWDRNRKSLFLARDRMGKKPLYYALLAGDRFIFGSELKALQTHPDLPRELDPRALEDYFALGYVPDPRTIYSAVHKLPPAHTLLLRQGEPPGEPRPYWDVPFKPLPAMSEVEAGAELVERLREATRVRLMSEVPLGAFLSGGVDSSAVVAMMAQSSNEPVNTCSIGFADPRYNESEFARQVAERYHTVHQTRQVDPDDFDLVDRLAGIYDEPYADSSALPTYRVCELARERVTVALSGDGGDELLAGYNRHRWHVNEEAVRGRIPGVLRHSLFGLLGRCYPRLDGAPRLLRLKSTFQALAMDSAEAYLNSVSVVPRVQRQQLYSAAFKQRLAGYDARELFEQHAARAPSDHPLSMVQYLDMKTYLPGDILTKVDRASMAHSLEVRAPLLDHQLTEWATGLPPDMLLRGRQGKYILKRALEPHLPNDVLYRPKMGFAVPLSAWFRGPLRQRVRDAVLGDTLRDTALFDPAALTRLVDEHQSGQAEHSPALWSLLMFESFLRRNGDAAVY